MLDVVRFDGVIYSLETVKKAVYRLSNLFAASIQAEDGAVLCHLIFPLNATDQDKNKAIAELHKEVLDQDLRATISKETEGYRNTILALAFSGTTLTDE